MGTKECGYVTLRKVVSQFDLENVDFVDIEHRLAINGDVEVNDIEGQHCHDLEFWQGGNNLIDDYDVSTMNKRWGHVDEDRLKIHFSCGTLYLRFIVDLKEMESRTMNMSVNTNNPDLTANIGTQTKVWCRTIARFVTLNVTRQVHVSISSYVYLSYVLFSLYLHFELSR